MNYVEIILYTLLCFFVEMWLMKFRIRLEKKFSSLLLGKISDRNLNFGNLKFFKCSNNVSLKTLFQNPS